MEEREYAAQLLEGGRQLVYLKSRFLKHTTPETYNWVLTCLRDTALVVPIVPETGKPDLMESEDGQKFVAVFSQPEQMPEDYRSEFELRYMGLGEALELAKAQEEAVAIVLDGLTEPMTITWQLGAASMRRPSRIGK